MAENDIETLGYRIYDAFNARDIEAAEQLFAPDFVSHGAGTVGELRKSLTFLFSVCPEVRFVVEDKLVEGDRFALRMTIHGVPLLPGKSQAILMEFFRTENGRVVEVWGTGSGFRFPPEAAS